MMLTYTLVLFTFPSLLIVANFPFLSTTWSENIQFESHIELEVKV